MITDSFMDMFLVVVLEVIFFLERVIRVSILAADSFFKIIKQKSYTGKMLVKKSMFVINPHPVLTEIAIEQVQRILLE